MSMLRSIESEIARKLAREMEEHRTFSLSRTYVPNEYRVFLSPRDRERFADYEDALISELTGYLLEHARRERLVLASRPVVEFETDDRLGLGEFGIQTRVVNPEPEAEEDIAPGQEASGRTMIYSTRGRGAGAAGGARPLAPADRAAADGRQAPGRRARRGHHGTQPSVRRDRR